MIVHVRLNVSDSGTLAGLPPEDLIEIIEYRINYFETASVKVRLAGATSGPFLRDDTQDERW